MDSSPRFVSMKAEKIDKVINLNHVCGAERIRAISREGNVVADKFFVRLDMLNGKEFTLYGETASAIWQVLEDASFPILFEQTKTEDVDES